jgi:uncharacterized alkaline shock family protein YloU
MPNFRLTSNNTQNGKIVYNVGILQNIVALAVAEVEGTVPSQGKKSGISLYIEKEGVYVDVSVVVKYGYNVPELAYRIQQTVKESVENMTHYKVMEVDVHVADVVFCEPAPAEKEEHPAEEPNAEESEASEAKVNE